MTEKRNISMIQRRLIPTYIFLIIVSFFSVFPFYWMISAATNTSFDVAQGKITIGGHLIENFNNLLANYDLWRAMGNSFVYAIVQVVLAILICSLAGFGFELYHDKGKDLVFSILLLAMMIPQVATMIPLFRLLSSAHLLNSVWGFILPSISTPFLIMMFRQNSRNFPVDTMEAARIDGCNPFQIYLKIFMPIIKPSLILIATLNMITVWNDYLGPLIFLQDRSKYTLALGLASFKGVHDTQIIPMLCITVIMIIPPIILFIIAQKYIVEGTSGSIK